MRLPGFVRKQLVQGNDVIVMYHGVDSCSNRTYNFRHISKDTFEAHLQFFSQFFRVTPLSEMFHPGQVEERPRLAITFDDGYRNNFDNAVPLLEAHRLPATIFVTAIRALNWDILWPDFWDLFASLSEVRRLELQDQVFVKNSERKYDPFISSSGTTLQSHMKDLTFPQKERWLKHALELEPEFRDKLAKYREYWELIDTESLQSFHSPYVQIGCHGLSHDNLGRLSRADRERELRESKAWLEKRLGNEIASLAYPDGCYNSELIDFAESLGFREQLAVSYKSQEDTADRRILNRVGVYAYQKPVEQLWEIVKVSGGNSKS